MHPLFYRRLNVFRYKLGICAILRLAQGPCCVSPWEHLNDGNIYITLDVLYTNTTKGQFVRSEKYRLV